MVAPADAHDALPFEGQGAHGDGMFFTFGDLFLEEEFGPGAVEDGLVGVFEEAGWVVVEFYINGHDGFSL